MLPDDRELAPTRVAPELLRDRGGEDARVAMEVRLRDAGVNPGSPTPRPLPEPARPIGLMSPSRPAIPPSLPAGAA